MDQSSGPRWRISRPWTAQHVVARKPGYVCFPICSMYGICTNIGNKNHPNVGFGECTIHGAWCGAPRYIYIYIYKNVCIYIYRVKAGGSPEWNYMLLKWNLKIIFWHGQKSLFHSSHRNYGISCFFDVLCSRQKCHNLLENHGRNDIRSSFKLHIQSGFLKESLGGSAPFVFSRCNFNAFRTESSPGFLWI